MRFPRLQCLLILAGLCLQIANCLGAVGDVVWRKTMKMVATPVLNSAGTLIVVSQDGFIFGLDAVTGRTRWQIKADTGMVRAPAINESGLLIAGDDNGNVYGVDSIQGRQLWKLRYSTSGAAQYRGAVVSSGNRAFVGYAADKLRAIDGLTGRILWEATPGIGNSLPSWFGMSPVLATDGTVILATTTGKLIGYAPDTGARLWEISGTGQYDSPPAIGSDGTVYVSAIVHSVVDALNVGSRSKKWGASLPGPITSSPVLGQDGSIFAGAWSKNFHCFNPSGTRKWSYTASDEIWGSALVAADGLVYVLSIDGVLHALQAASGAVSWKYDPRSSAKVKFVDVSPVLGPAGLIYIPTPDTTQILAIQSASSSLSGSGWASYKGGSMGGGSIPELPSAIFISPPPYVIMGTSLRLEVAGFGQAPVSYQWNLNGTAISGATNKVYSVASARFPEDAGSYTVTLSNSLGVASSPVHELKVLEHLPPVWGTVSPAAGTTEAHVVPLVSAWITNRETRVLLSSIKVLFNGTNVTSQSVVRENAGVVSIQYQSPLLASNLACRVEIQMQDDANPPVDLSYGWSFRTANVPIIPASYKLVAPPSTTSGFTARAVQAGAGVTIANTLEDAEKLLAGNPSLRPVFSNVVAVPTINFRTTSSDQGLFTSPLASNLKMSTTSRDGAHAVEFTGYLELEPGFYKFGGHVDDGFSIIVSPTLRPGSGLNVGIAFDGTVGEKTLSFFILEKGFYPFRIPYWNWTLGIEGWLELYNIEPGTNRRRLIGAPGDPAAIKVFVNPLPGINLAPSIAAVPSQAMDQDTALGPLSITLSDPDSSPSVLTLRASSSNQQLLPDSSVVLGGTDLARTLTVTPAPGRSGEVTITLTASDGGASTSTSFVLTVRRVGIPLGFSGLVDLVGDEDLELGPLPFTVRGVDSASTGLTVSATSSDPNLLPASGIVLSGSGTNRTLLLKPAANRNGTVRLDFQADDGLQKAGLSITVLIRPVNDAPSLKTPPVARTAQIEAISVPLSGLLLDVDLPADSHRYSLVSGPAGATVDPISGLLTWTPGVQTPPGSYSILVAVADSGGRGLVAQAEQKVEVTRSLFLPVLDSKLPQDRTNRLGDAVSFEIGLLGGTEPMRIQWLFNGASIDGQTNRVLELASVVPAQAGLYSVRVVNEAGVAGSREAKLVVNLDTPNLEPTVKVVSPVDFQVFTPGALIPIQAQAEDADGVVQSVTFFDGEKVIGAVTNRPFRLEARISETGLHLITALAVDNRGGSARSEVITLEVTEVPGVPLLTVDSPKLTEGTQPLGGGAFGTVPMIFNFRLSAVSTAPVVFSYRTQDGTASSGSDYRSSEGVIVIQAGELEKQVTVDVISDSFADSDSAGTSGGEVFYLTLFNVAHAVPVQAQPTGTILDDDAPVEVFFNSGIVRQFEGDQGVKQVVFKVRLSSPANQSGSVEFQTVDGSARAGRDYLQSAGRVEFVAGQSEGEIRVPIIPDTLRQGGERSFQVRLTNPSNLRLSPGRESAEGVIVDDDGLGELSIQGIQVLEGNEAFKDVELKVALAKPSETVVKVGYRTVPVDAVEGIDFRAARGDLEIAPGRTNVTLLIGIVGNLIDQGDRSFRVVLENESGATVKEGTAVVTILDDDAAPTVSVEDASILEGNEGITELLLKVRLSGPSASSVVVGYRTLGGSAVAGQDFTAVQGQFSLAPGSTESTIAIPILANRIDQPDRGFRLILENPVGVTVGDGEASVLILDDDAPPTVFIEDARVLEGDEGVNRLNLKVNLSEASAGPVEVSYKTINGTAVGGVDFDPVSGVVRFVPGNASATIDLPIRGNKVDQPDRTFRLALFQPDGAVLKGKGESVVEILDDDEPPTLSIQGIRVDEGNTGSREVFLKLALSAPSGNPVTVSYRTLEQTAVAGVDFVTAQGQIVLGPGGTNSAIGVLIHANTVNQPDRTLRVVLESVTGATLANTEATLTIADDDSAPLISIQGGTVNEGNIGATDVVLNVSLSVASGIPVSVNYRTAPGTALEGADYATASGKVSFSPGSTNSTLVVRINANTLDEPDRTFRVLLENPAGASVGVGAGEALITIKDDDLPPTLSITAGRIDEGGPGMTNEVVLTATLSAPSGRRISVAFATKEGSALAGRDFIPTSGVLVFGPGETTGHVRIPVPGDSLNEGLEIFEVELGSPEFVVLSTSRALVSILDDDAAPEIRGRNVVLKEGTSGNQELEMELTLSGPSGLPVGVKVKAVSGSAAEVEDYQLNPTILTFAPGETAIRFKVVIVGDGEPEPDEFFTIQLSDSTNASIANADLRVDLQNDDERPKLPPTLASISDQSVTVNQRANVALQIADGDTELQMLEVKAAVAGSSLFPPGSTRVEFNNGAWMLTMIPAIDQVGSATVEVSVSDGQSSVVRNFRLGVVQTNTPPIILTQPASRSVLVGTSVELLASVGGTGPFLFQWRMNGTNLPGATNASLQLSAVQPASSGRYVLHVSNAAGSTTTEEVSLLVGRLGSKLWDFTTEGQIFSSASVDADSRLVLVGGDDGRLRALRRDGVLQWAFDAGAGIGGSPSISSSGSILFGTRGGTFFALDSGGRELWRFEAGAGIESTPAIASDGTIYFGAQDNQFRALNPNGTLKWNLSVAGLIYSSAAVGRNGVVHFGSYDRRLYAVSPAGVKLWDFETGGAISSSPAIGRDGTIYFGSADGFLYALSPDGTRKWRYATGNGISSSPVIGTNGVLYFGSEDGRFHAVDGNGARQWEFNTRIPIYSTPALGVDGTIYFGGFDNRLYALNPNGSKRWEFAAGGPIYSSPLLDADGVVYVGALDNKMYAIQGTTALADTPWPMFRRGPFHDGRVVLPSESGPTRLAVVGIQEDGAVTLEIATQGGGKVGIEVSSDLETWKNLETISTALPTVRFTDRAAERPRQRFYRVRNSP